MFVHYFADVDLPMAVVERRVDELRSSLDSFAHVAYREGEELRARVGPRLTGYAKEVRLDIGVPEVHRSGLIYPIRWTATGAEALFPVLNAELILSHVGPDHTRMSFEGTYEPPLGALGRVVDRVLLGRVAESTVKRWVDQLAAALVSDTKVT